MAKFAVKDPNDDDAPVKLAMDEVHAINNMQYTQPSIAIPPPPVKPQPIVLPIVSPVASPVVSPSVVVIDNNMMGAGSSTMAQQTVQMQSVQATAQAQASVGLAQTNIDQQVVDEQIKKEEEHWVKSYWRPAMGWLYMAICFMDFIGFPLISMFLPVIFKHDGLNANYVAWQSLSLSNGGLMHLAFGAILGVSAWTRGQEKLAKIN